MLLFFAGCPMNRPDSEINQDSGTDAHTATGSIVISFTGGSAGSRGIKTWIPDISMTIASYGITLTGPDDAVRVEAVSADEAASSVTIGELQTGYWNVVIDAFNGPVTESELAELRSPPNRAVESSSANRASGTAASRSSDAAACIASGCASDILVTADTAAEAAIDLAPLGGAGTLTVSRIVWDPADGSDKAAFITDPYAKISITGADDEAADGSDAGASEDIETVFPLAGNGTPLHEDGTAAPYPVGELEAGWYRAEVSIYDGDPDAGLFASAVHCWTSPYSFRIVSGCATDITIQDDEINYGTAPLNLSVSAEMQNPFEVYFTAVSDDTPADPSRANSYFDSGETIIITPDPGTGDFSDQAVFSWYADGVPVENPQPAHLDTPEDRAIAYTFSEGGIREIALFVLEPAADGDSLSAGACCGYGRVFHIDQETLVFDANGGSGSMQPVTLALGSSVQLPENQFTPPEGSDGSDGSDESLFDRWNTAPDGSGAVFDEQSTYTAGSESRETVLYAVWKDDGQS